MTAHNHRYDDDRLNRAWVLQAAIARAAGWDEETFVDAICSDDAPLELVDRIRLVWKIETP